MTALTRQALVEAAAKAIVADFGVMEDEAQDEATSAVDAVFPLIADAIEAQRDGSDAAYDCALENSADLVRSLMGADDEH